MVHTSEAHETLSMLFKRDGVPPKIFADNSKEQSLGNFAKKCREADYRLVNTEPHSLWMMAAEGCIKELKHGSSCKILKTGSPKRLWDHCIERDALIRLHTALDIYAIQG